MAALGVNRELRQEGAGNHRSGQSGQCVTIWPSMRLSVLIMFVDTGKLFLQVGKAEGLL